MKCEADNCSTNPEAINATFIIRGEGGPIRVCVPCFSRLRLNTLPKAIPTGVIN